METKYFYVVVDMVDRKLGISYDAWKSPMTFWRPDCAIGDCFRVKSPSGWSEEVRRERLFEHRNMLVKKVEISKLYEMVLPLTEKGNSKQFLYAIWDRNKEEMLLLYMHLPLFFSKEMADKQFKRLTGKRSWKKEFRKEKLAEYKNIELCKINRTALFELLNHSLSVGKKEKIKNRL